MGRINFPDIAMMEKNWINFPESVIAVYRSWSNHTSVGNTFLGDQIKFCVFARRDTYRIVLRAEMRVGNWSRVKGSSLFIYQTHNLYIDIRLEIL